MPEQAPDQPLKTCPDAGNAFKITVVPLEADMLQAEPLSQLIPEGVLLMAPGPEMAI